MLEHFALLWLVMSGTPSLLYAVCNHIDKLLLEEYFEGELGVLTLLFVSSLVSVIALPFLWYLSPTSMIPEDWTHIPIFVLVGLLHVALLWFYLTALKGEETTTIVVVYSVLPILGLLTSNFFLGEMLLPMQLVAMVVIIVGVLIVSFEKNGEEGYNFKIKVIFLMSMASLCWALGDVAFKIVALEENVWRSLFWEHITLTVVGALMYFFVPKIRIQLRQAMKLNSKKILALNMTSEVLYIIANVVSAFPLMMVQIATVHLVQAFQPVWVFLIALGLYSLGVKKVKFTLGQIIQKGTATVIVVYGMYLLVVHTPT